MFDGSADQTLSVTVKDDSHNHTIANVDGLQNALNEGTRQATESTQGQAEIATEAEVNAGTDHKADTCDSRRTLASRLTAKFARTDIRTTFRSGIYTTGKPSPRHFRGVSDAI